MPEKERLLQLALKGLEAERAKIDDEIAQIRSQLGYGRRGVASGASAAGPPRKRRKMSAAARKKISEAMKRRHAARRAALKKQS